MKKIIVVDDDPGILDCLDLILSRAGYAVTVYADAAPLLKGDFELPDIFILDKQLQDADGLDVCRFLKAQKKTSNIPVIMISANLHINPTAKEAGASGFLEKPFRMKELLIMVNKYILN
jgi:DNA-binding response OmpR family regulator